MPNDPGPSAHDVSGPDALAVELGLTRTVARILWARGFQDPAATRAFLELRLADLTAPHGMADREIASERLAAAITRGERVVVFGDYDVDGITATAIVTTFVRALGGVAEPLLASRFDGGYGFSTRALERVLERRPQLVVTCDCGSSDHERLLQLRQRGIDVLVIDHHLVPPEPLPVLAFLNPHRPECAFPYKHLASCGLALTVGAAVRARMGKTLDLRPLLDLVALGTIADVAPLVGDNRALVRSGLQRLSLEPRPGLLALGEVVGIRRGAGLTAEDVSFRFAPRLNAPGRLHSPEPALELLLSTDVGRARILAAKLEQDTRTRREIESGVMEAALVQIRDTHQGESAAIVVAAQGWHFGVVGIVAARLVERFGVPAAVIALSGKDGRGSVRGPSGAKLHDALVESRHTLVGFGGHQAAAGLHVEEKSLADFREAFAAACAASQAIHPGVEAPAGVALDPGDEPLAIVRDLERLEPCGEGHPLPLFTVCGARVLSTRIMKERHLRCTVDFQGRRLEAFGFGLAGPELPPNTVIDLSGHLRRDGFRGGDAVEFRIRTLRRCD